MTLFPPKYQSIVREVLQINDRIRPHDAEFTLPPLSMLSEDKKKELERAHPIEVILNPGDLIILPHGIFFYHSYPDFLLDVRHFL